MNAEALLAQLIPDSRLFDLLLKHSRAVLRKARAIAALSDRDIDMFFVEEAAMLHDVGVIGVNAPSIFCFGDKPYICHGVIGSQILCDLGLPKHALVCERHTGSGLTLGEVIGQNLPLPHRDYLPVTNEEKLVCLADKFYSKNPEKLDIEKTWEEVRADALKHGEASFERLRDMADFFSFSPAP